MTAKAEGSVSFFAPGEILTRENGRHHSCEHEKHHRKKDAAGIAHHLRGLVTDVVIDRTDEEPNDYVRNQPYSR